MRVVVTGGAGFIGANLVASLCREPRIDNVAVIDDLSTGSRANLAGLPVRFVEASVHDRDALGQLAGTADAIVHLAARPSVPRSLRDPVATHDANATGTLAVLEAARAAGSVHVIVASSSSVYGRNEVLPKHEDLTPAPVSPYAASKLAAEAYSLAYADSFDLPVLAFRFFNVFGPLQRHDHAYAAVIPRFLHAALTGRPLQVHGDGRQTRDFTYVGSVVRVLTDAVLRRVTSATPTNLAFGTRRTLLDVIAALERELRTELRVDNGPPRSGDVRHSQADTGRLRTLFPDLEPVGFEEGLRDTIVWARLDQDARGGRVWMTS